MKARRMMPLSQLNFSENAIFYKDTSQWLRQKRMSVLLMGLMALGLAAVLLPGTVSIVMQQPGTGMVAILLLIFIYGFFGFFLLAGSGIAIAREFSTRTYELYEATGLTPEDMMKGRLLSICTFMLIGLAVLLPYAVLSWMLGGVDFTFLIALVLLGLAAIPSCAVVLVTLAYSMRYAGATLMRPLPMIILAILALFILPNILFLPFMLLPFLFMGSSFSSANPVPEILNALLSQSAWVWLEIAFWLALWIESLVLIFYHGTHKLCRPCDTRSFQIRGMLSLMVITWATLQLLLVPLRSGSPVTIVHVTTSLIPLLIISIVLVGKTLYGRRHPPQAFAFQYGYDGTVLRGRVGGSGLKHRLHVLALQCFGPYKRSVVRQTFLILGAGALLMALALLHNFRLLPAGTSSAARASLVMHPLDWLEALSLLLLFGLFVPLFPAGLFQNSRSSLERANRLETTIPVTWMVITMLLVAGWMFNSFEKIGPLRFSFLYGFLQNMTALFIPLKWGFPFEDSEHPQLLRITFITIRLLIAGLGFFMMLAWLRTDARREEREKAPPPLPLPAAPPPLNSQIQDTRQEEATTPCQDAGPTA